MALPHRAEADVSIYLTANTDVELSLQSTTHYAAAKFTVDHGKDSYTHVAVKGTLAYNTWELIEHKPLTLKFVREREGAQWEITFHNGPTDLVAQISFAVDQVDGERIQALNGATAQVRWS